jgi:hypothetical protein
MGFMRNTRSLLLWVIAGLAGLTALAWAWPRVYPLMPRPWEVTGAEAEAIALERLRDLGEPVEDPYVVTGLETNPILERRLQVAAGERGGLPAGAAELEDRLVLWQVFVYPRGVVREDWAYRALLSLSGEVMALQLRLDPLVAGESISPAEARSRAEGFLAEQGFDLAGFGEPQVRSQQLAARTDLAVRFPRRGEPLGEGISHGVQVHFAGDRLAGFSPWVEDPGERPFQKTFQNLQFLEVARLVLVYLFGALLAFPFLKRYHEGEIGVRRGTQIFFLVLAAGLLAVLLSARAGAQNVGFGFATREQTTWVLVVFSIVFNVVPSAMLAFFAWSVGEALCRERAGHKLAAFDAVFHGDLRNATVARSALVGWSAGLFTAGLLALLLLALQRLDAWPLLGSLAVSSPWPGLQRVFEFLADLLPFFLVVVLWLLPLATRRFGRAGAVVLALVVGAVVVNPPAVVVPLGWGLLAALAFAALPVLLFLFTDLLTVLVAGAVAYVLFTVWPLLQAGDALLQAHGWLALGVAAAPLVASLRWLGSGREFVYAYEDVPPHVRRIAERERQRVELETARRIQSSILPELPPRLNGVDLAHAYLPASEVGGDFYDVLALEDGRIALAVGDVAGHGVSSGLVMSMARSALAVQVTFDPEVAAVFRTLNRTVFQSARKRLLATLCYALLDPARRELVYASAGHLFPYRIEPSGRVESLESIAYPLGVRETIEVDPRLARLGAGDVLFLFSDGIVEARAEGSDDLFGFDRLEESLSRHAGRGVEGLRDAVLADVARFTRQAPREDDQTILVLRVP